jgi:hypothetical protein
MEEALNVLDEKGWHQGSSENEETGAVCAMQAVRRARYRLISRGQRAFKALIDCDDIMKQHIPEDWKPPLNSDESLALVAQYNDDPRTTLEDIKLLFKRSIEDTPNA